MTAVPESNRLISALAWVRRSVGDATTRWTAWITADTAVAGDRLIAAMAAFCVLIAPLTYFQAFCDGAISLVAILLLVRSWRLKDFAWARGSWFWAALAFWAYITLRTLDTAQHTALTAGSGLAWIRFPLGVAAMVMLINVLPKLPRLMLWAYTLTVSFGVFDALFQRVFGHDVFGWQIPAQSARLTSPTGKLDIGAKLGQIGMVLAAWAITVVVDRRRSWQQRAGALAGLVLLTAAILLSGERMAFLIYFVSIALALVFIGRLHWRKAILAIVGVAVAVAVLMVSYAPLRDRLVNTQSQIEQGLNTTYIQTPLTGVRVFADFPWFGAGFKQYRYICMDHQPPTIDPMSCNIHPHNFWIEVLAENGVIGALPFFVLIGLLVVPVVRSWRRWPTEPLLGGTAIAALMHLWPLATTGSFFVNQREVIFWPLIGFALAMALAKPTGATVEKPLGEGSTTAPSS